MTGHKKGKFIRLVVFLFRESACWILISVAMKAAFLIAQLGGIWLIFSWITGGVPEAVVSLIGLHPESNYYAVIGASCIFLSSVFALASKVIALKATANVEMVLVSGQEKTGAALLPGDLKNIVKVVLSIIDIVVPALLMVSVIILWASVTPYSILVVALLFVAGLWMIRRGVHFSAKKYAAPKVRSTISNYLNSGEHQTFYRVLLLPSYISVVTFGIISGSIVISVLVAKQYLQSGIWYTDLLIIATAVSFLQIRTFTGIIQRMGAYNQSLLKADSILLSLTEAKAQ